MSVQQLDQVALFTRCFLLLFFSGSFLGWVFEYIVRGATLPPDYGASLFANLPITWVYGVGLVGQWFMYRGICQWPWYLRAAAYAVVFTLFEYIAGHAMLAVDGKRYWDYSDMPLGQLGFIGLYSSVAWVGLGFVGEQLFFKRNWFKGVCGGCPVNLDQDVKRWTTLSQRLKDLGITVTRWSAVHGKSMPLADRVACTTLACDSFCVHGAIGCALSHCGIWQDMNARGIERALVLEDDAIFPDDFQEKFAKLWKQVPKNWDTVYLGCFGANGPPENYTAAETISGWTSKLTADSSTVPTEIAPNIWIPEAPSGTHAYALTRRAAAAYLQDNFPVPFPGHIDMLMGKTNPRLNVYAFYPSLISQPLTTGSSVIASDRPYALNRILDTVTVDQNGMSAAWRMSESGLRIGPYDFNCWHMAYLLLGTGVAGLSQRPMLWILMFFVLLMLDAGANGRFDETERARKEMGELLVDVAVFSVPSLVKWMFTT